jgi:hypothetical protein
MVQKLSMKLASLIQETHKVYYSLVPTYKNQLVDHVPEAFQKSNFS